ncbi:MAG: DUF1616 domain-containing protein [Candidatus Bathyarchaeota archaeon]|nr:DUF1616 domain-containing protein [Candidatus Bathyarchaeota archaeon]MDW8040611.1 DUF1616 domain-containing protein [Nitrososphaerota archaeon]
MKRDFLKRVKRFYEKDSYFTSITIALIIAFLLLIHSYIVYMKPKDFVSFSILDHQKEAKNYPELLIIGKNNTCCLWIVVENHMEKNVAFKVLLKITSEPLHSIPLQVECYGSYSSASGSLNKGEKWEKQVEISLDEAGDFSLVFELWIHNEKTGDFEFSGNFCVLPLKVREA